MRATDPREILRDEKDEWWLSLSVAERIRETVREQNMIGQSRIVGAAERIRERRKISKKI